MIRIGAANGFLAPVTPELRIVRLFLFLFLSAVLLVATTLALVLGVEASGFGDIVANLPEGALPDGPQRLVEESRFIAVLCLILTLMAVPILAAAVIVYRRAPRTFLWPGRRFSPRLLILGFVFMMVAAGIAGGVATLLGTEYEAPLLNSLYTAETRLLYAGVATLFLLGAAAAEEVVMRGVLLQITAGFTRNAAILCVLNGLIFAAIHVDPDPIAFIARGLSGIAWSWAALRLGGLEFAIGAHWANNLMIALFAEPFSAASAIGEAYPAEALLYEVPIALATVIAVEFLVRRRTRPAS